MPKLEKSKSYRLEMKKSFFIIFVILAIFLLPMGCRTYKSLEDENKEIKSLEDKDFKNLISKMKANETYKIKTDSASFNFVYLNNKDTKFTGYKKGKKEDTLAIYKENLIFIKESKFSRFKTDLFTVSSYVASGVLIYMLLK